MFQVLDTLQEGSSEVTEIQCEELKRLLTQPFFMVSNIPFIENNIYSWYTCAHVCMPVYVSVVYYFLSLITVIFFAI